MSRILWISDAGTNTGFARVTHEIGERLQEAGHDIHVLAIGWDPEDSISTTSLTLYRANAGKAHHHLGFDRVVELLERVEPDVVVTLEDAPMLLTRLLKNPWDPEQLLRQYRPIISYLPVDGYNLPPSWQQLRQLTNVVTMTKFGQEAFSGSQMVYHGIDSVLFHPVSAEHPIESSEGLLKSKAECREALKISQKAFVVGRHDTNSGRKDWASTWRVVEGLRHRGRPEEIIGLFHTKNDQGGGVDFGALIDRSEGPYLITGADNWPEGDLVALLNAMDVYLTTSRGEGFGLGIAEAMACEIPVVATSCSAITEVVGPGGILVEGKTIWTNPFGVDLMFADVKEMASQLVLLSKNPEWRAQLGKAGRQHVIDNFSWDRAAVAFNGYINALDRMVKQQESDVALSAEPS